MNFENATELVKEVVREHPEAIDNKKILVTKVWEKQGLYLTDEQIDILLTVTTPETLTRCLRKLIADKEIRPSLNQMRATAQREKLYRDHFKKDLPIETKTLRYIQTGPNTLLPVYETTVIEPKQEVLI